MWKHSGHATIVYSVVRYSFVYIHRTGGFERVSAEACAMAKPVISTNHGGSREIIENNVTGWLVEPRNPGRLADRIILRTWLRSKKERFNR